MTSQSLRWAMRHRLTRISFFFLPGANPKAAQWPQRTSTLHCANCWVQLVACSPILPSLLGPGWLGVGKYLLQSVSNFYEDWVCHDSYCSAFPWPLGWPCFSSEGGWGIWAGRKFWKWSQIKKKKQSKTQILFPNDAFDREATGHPSGGSSSGSLMEGRDHL